MAIKLTNAQKINRLLRKLGFEVKRFDTTRNESKKLPSFFEGLLEGLTLNYDQRIKIIQIGANDAQTKDPISNFVRNNFDRTSILLIEPISKVMEKLMNNYSFHNHAIFVNSAVSSKNESFELFMISKELQEPYKQKTGVDPSLCSSRYKEYVTNHICQIFKINRDEAEKEIISISVESRTLYTILENVSFPEQIDVLQIDANGCDDNIIYSANIDTLSPKIINFDCLFFDKRRLNKVCNHLSRLGYANFRWKKIISVPY